MSWTKMAARLVFLGLAVTAPIISQVGPLHQWDMIAYVGAVKYVDNQDPDTVHQYAYSEFQGSVAPEDFAELAPDTERSGDGGYRAAMKHDARAFVEQLSYYQIRPLYIGPVYLATKLGMRPVKATHLIAGISVAIAFVFLYLAGSRVLPAPLLFIAAPMAVLVGGLDLARRASPDGTSFATMMILTYLITSGKWRGLLIALPIAVGARTDLVLFTFPLYALLFLQEGSDKKKLSISVIASFIVYIVVNKVAHNPGWFTTFVHAFVDKQYYPITRPPAFSLSLYLSVLLHQGIMQNHWLNRIVMVYEVILLASGYLIWQKSVASNLRRAIGEPSAMLAIASAAYVAGHFFIFPVFWERYFTPVYVASIVAVLWLLAQRPWEAAGTRVQAPTGAAAV